MVLKSEFNERYGKNIKIYLEAFPYKIRDLDLSIILDSGYEYSRYWIRSIKWLPRNQRDQILSYFADGGKLWVTDICNVESILTKDILMIGVGLALEKYEKYMVDYKQEINASCISEKMCNEIIQLSLYGKIKF